MSCARCTVAMPPTPSSRMTRYRSAIAVERRSTLRLVSVMLGGRTYRQGANRGSDAGRLRFAQSVERPDGCRSRRGVRRFRATSTERFVSISRPLVTLALCVVGAMPAHAQRPVKVYISVDMEGVGGVVTEQQLGPAGFEYARA